MRIDHATRIQHHHELLDVEPAAAADGHPGAGRGDGAVRLDDRHAHAFAIREIGAEAGFLLQRLEHELPVGHPFRHLDAPLERIPSARDRHLVDEHLRHEAELVGARRAMRRARDVGLRVVPLVLTMRNLVGHVVDAVVGGGAADLVHAVLREPSRTREERGRQAVVADRRAELGDRERTLLVLCQVLFTRPDHLHGPADLF